ncbi:YHYH domain-containing protein [Skermanella stibiiresistens]
MRSRLLAVLCAVAVFLPSLAFAHSGGLDRNGCHHDRKKGTYHCH